jgi:hypothetical protein
MGKRGFQPHPRLSSASNIRALMREHCWCVPEAAASLGLTKARVYLALKAFGVTIPKRQAQAIKKRQATQAAAARWRKA